MRLNALRGMGFLGSMALIGGVFVVCERTSFAGTTFPALQLLVQAGDGPVWTYTPEGTDTDGDGVFEYSGDYGGNDWSMAFDATADQDPFVNSVIGFQNNTGVAQNYTITVIMPTIAIPGSSLMGGSMGGSVTDANANGVATVSTVGTDAIYTGLIDLAAVSNATLLDAPFASNPVPFAGGTSVFGPASFGLPGPTEPGPAVASSIGIQLRFNLTAGDTVAMTAFFQVEPVPAPGAIGMFGLALLCGRRRRR